MMIFRLIIPASLDCLNLFWSRKMLLVVLKALNTKDVDENAKPKPRKRDQKPINKFQCNYNEEKARDLEETARLNIA